MSVHYELAEAIRGSRRRRKPIPPISTGYPGLTPRDGYVIQRLLRDADLAAGKRIVGYKVGSTSEPIRRMFNIDTPHYGYVTDEMVLTTGVDLTFDDLISPLVEGEVGFLLKAALPGRDTTAADVRAATSHIVPALEVLDTCTVDWKVKEVDAIADNASSRFMVLGRPVPATGLDLIEEEMLLSVDEVTRHGRGKAVLGDPAESVAWLAHALADFDESLDADVTVFAGAWTRAQKFSRGSSVEAKFKNLGSVAMTVS